MTKYYVDERATGANDGDPGGETGPDANGIYQDAFRSIADISGIDNSGHELIFVVPTGTIPKLRITSTWIGEANNLAIKTSSPTGFVNISGGVDLNGSAYKWTRSPSNPLEYYCELAGGGDPSLAEVKAANVNGRFYETSAEEDAYQMGTVGSLADGFIGWGDNDTLGFDTVYVRWDAGTPADITVDVAQLDYVFNSNYTGQTVENIIFELANISVVRARNATTTCKYRRIIQKYAAGNGLSYEGNGASSRVDMEAFVSYFTHRLFAHQSTIGDGNSRILNVRNCLNLKGHLFGLVSATVGVGSTSEVHLRNNVTFLTSNGFLDVDETDTTLDEDYSCMWVAFSGGTNALGYTGTANWTTTGANSLPPSAATTISTVAANEAAGAVDPELVVGGVALDATNIDTLTDADLVAIALAVDSSVIAAGQKWWSTDPRLVGIDGEPFPDFGISMGPVQSKAVPFHPTQL